MSEKRTIEKLLRQQAALATFGSFAFRERDLKRILDAMTSVERRNQAGARLRATH
jgi:hypothetical protein